MSGKSRLVYLQEKISRTKTDGRFGELTVVVGFVLISLYIASPLIFPDLGQAPLSILIAGVIICFMGGSMIAHSNLQYRSIIRELEQMERTQNSAKETQQE